MFENSGWRVTVSGPDRYANVLWWAPSSVTQRGAPAAATAAVAGIPSRTILLVLYLVRRTTLHGPTYMQASFALGRTAPHQTPVSSSHSQPLFSSKPKPSTSLPVRLPTMHPSVAWQAAFSTKYTFAFRFTTVRCNGRSLFSLSFLLYLASLFSSLSPSLLMSPHFDPLFSSASLFSVILAPVFAAQRSS